MQRCGLHSKHAIGIMSHSVRQTFQRINEVRLREQPWSRSMPGRRRINRPGLSLSVTRKPTLAVEDSGAVSPISLVSSVLGAQMALHENMLWVSVGSIIHGLDVQVRLTPLDCAYVY